MHNHTHKFDSWLHSWICKVYMRKVRFDQLEPSPLTTVLDTSGQGLWFTRLRRLTDKKPKAVLCGDTISLILDCSGGNRNFNI